MTSQQVCVPELGKIYLQTHSPLVTNGHHSLCPELCLQTLVLPMGHCLRDVSTQSCTLILPVGTIKIMYLPMDSTVAMMRLWTDVLPVDLLSL